MYYYKVYTTGIFGTCVYTSELFDTKAEAEKYAKQCESSDHCTSVYEYRSIGDRKYMENSEEFCLGDYE